MGTPKEDSGSRFFKAVEKGMIHPQEARALVDNEKRRARESNAGASESEIRAIVANEIVDRYSALAALNGGAAALTGIVPGVGAAVSIVGGGMAHALVSMRLLANMTACLAETFGMDLDAERARRNVLLLAVAGTVGDTGVEAATQGAFRAGHALMRDHLGAIALGSTKQLFRHLGAVYKRRTLLRALPFGAGVLAAAAADYALTMSVGKSAISWLAGEGGGEYDRALRD